jgi:hypothetical protein
MKAKILLSCSKHSANRFYPGKSRPHHTLILEQPLVTVLPSLLHWDVPNKIILHTLLIFNWWVQVGPLGTTATNRPIVQAPADYDDGEIGGMMIGRGNRSSRRKRAPVPLCPPQNPHAARTRTRAAVVPFSFLPCLLCDPNVLQCPIFLLHLISLYYMLWSTLNFKTNFQIFIIFCII